ncbi:hypothetical protein J2Z79_002491 [Symbiobacterium terraclitae]|uniref:Uncharacterized protein n=1 Tax=Symbiobacterium terraclitae TaxID=557451 RepID=A0ABS4JU61_9FIRM|nr:hypothetical protein [Symbiobacterium terraclitae]
MLSGRKGIVIKPRGITQYKDSTSGKTILSARGVLTATQRKDAFEELVERLCQYYWELVGIRVEPRVVRQLLKSPHKAW